MKSIIPFLFLFLFINWVPCPAQTITPKGVNSSHLLKQSKKKQTEFLSSLHDMFLLTDEAFDSLLKTYQLSDLKRPLELIRKSEHAVILDLDELPSDPLAAYRKMFENITSIVPDCEDALFTIHLNQEKVKIPKEVRIHQESSDNKVEKYYFTSTTTIKSNIHGQEYEHSFPCYYADTKTFISEFSFDHLGSDSDLLKPYGFYQIFNKILIDRKDPRRLYYVYDSWANDEGQYEKEFGLILLTREQADEWNAKAHKDVYKSTFYLPFISIENHEGTFTSVVTANTINTYQRLGLFSHLNNKQIEEGKECVNHSIIQHYRDVLNCFPNVVAKLSLHTRVSDAPYVSLLERLTAISGGTFKPTKIVDQFNETVFGSSDTVIFEVAFSFNKKPYSNEVNLTKSWFDSDFLVFINEVLSDNGVNGKFYLFNGRNDYKSIIFLESDQFQQLQQSQGELFE